MIKLIDDVETLTNVSEKLLKKFIPVINYSISHAVHEEQCQQHPVTEVDVGIGQLHIKVEDTGIRYRFVPSKELEKLILQTVCSRTSPIITKLEHNLQEKIERSYKELL